MEQALRESENRSRTTLQDIQNIAVQGYAPDGTGAVLEIPLQRGFMITGAQEHLVEPVGI